MITTRASRSLLRELSSPTRPSHIYASIARRALTTTPSRRAQLPNPPPPQTPPPVSQQQAERALLAKLSTLTPGQISTLLSTPPGTLPAAPSPQPAGAPPQQSRLRRWTPRLAIALLSLYLGYSLGDELLASSALLRSLSYPDQVDWDPRTDPTFDGIPPQAAQTENALSYQAEYPLALPLLDRSRRDATYHVEADTGVLTTPDDDALPLAWPAHAELPAHLRPAHLVTGPLGDPNALGFLHHVFRDQHTGQLSLFLMFGAATQGFPGVVHGGALATVMDEAMGRVAAHAFGGAAPVTANMDVRYAAPLAPYALVVVRTTIMDDTAVARQEARVRRAKMIKPWEKADGWEMVGRPLQQQDPAAAAAASTAVAKSDEARRDERSRKMWVVARMELATTGELVCEATGLFVVPKGVDLKPIDWLW
ncbi:hypothetical protein ACHAQA_002113 [Verticillium albo-atrum]